MNVSNCFFIFILLIVTSVNLFPNTASIKVYTSLVDYKSFFSDEDVQLLSYNLNDAGLVSSKVKVSGSMMIEGVYTTFTAELDSLLKGQDNNQNGIFDFYETDQTYNTSISGSASYNLQGYGSFSANLFAAISRLGNQHSFNMNQTVTIQSSTISGINAGQTDYLSETLNAIHAMGTITYDRNLGTYSYSLGYYGTTGNSFGSGTYQANSDNSLTFSDFTFPSMDEAAMASSFPGLAQKNLSGSVTIPYVNNGKFHVMTALSDVPYYVVIEDFNDQDGDSLPDLIPPSPVPAPDTVIGKVYEESYFDTYNSEQVTETIYFPSADLHFRKEVGQRSGFLGVQAGTYLWSASRNQGTLTTTESIGVGNYNLLFESENSGSSEYSFLGQSNITGTFTLDDAPSVNLPSSLTGLIYTESYFDTVTQEQSVETLYFHSDSEVTAYYHGENSGPDSIKNYTYTWSSDNNLGSLVIVYPPDPTFPENGYTSGTYSLLFETESSGINYFKSSDNYAASGSFSFSEGSLGFAPTTLVNQQIVIDGMTYTFKEDGVATTRSNAGTTNTTYLFIKTSPDSAFLQTPVQNDPGPDLVSGTSDDNTVQNIKLDFTSSDGGTLSGDKIGSFTYYPEGTSPPTAKGWMWFDHYPWVYSENAGGWLYYAPSGTRLMVYSAQEKTWQEM